MRLRFRYVIFWLVASLIASVSLHVILTGKFDATSSYYRNSSLVNVSLFLFLVIMGLGLYLMRERARIFYGILEVLFAVATLAYISASIDYLSMGFINISNSNLPPDAANVTVSKFVALFGAVYVFVRGLDNIGSGLRQREESSWNDFVLIENSKAEPLSGRQMKIVKLGAIVMGTIIFFEIFRFQAFMP